MFLPKRVVRKLRIHDEFRTTIALVVGLAGGTTDNGIDATTGLGGNALHAEVSEHILDGICTAFAESHIILFGTALIAVANDLDGIDIAAGLEAGSILLDGGFGITTDGSFIEIEIGELRLANGCIDAVLVAADFAGGAIVIDQALRLGRAAVVLANVVFGAILSNGLRIALGAAATVAAFLAGRAVNPYIRIAIAVDALARTIVANIALVFLAGAVLVITALCALCVYAILIIRLFADARRAVIVIVALGIGRGTPIGETNHKSGRDHGQ